MKKLLKIFISTVIAVMLAVMAGCSFKLETPNIERPSQTVTNTTILYNTSANVTTSNNEVDYSTAAELVKRTSVAIQMSGGAGSGVIVDMKGDQDPETTIYIITCHHVIEDMGSITVFVPDENFSYDNDDYTFTGTIGPEIYNDQAVTLVGGDKTSDIALLKLDLTKPAKSGNNLSVSKIDKAKFQKDGDNLTYSVKYGESVFAIGNPTGILPGSFAAGHISYLERETSIDSIGNMTLMQITATINPGNSGGGLYNLKGELIAITNSGNPDYQAINFAIPAVISNGNGFHDITAKLLKTKTANNYGYVEGRKAQFGITVAQTASDLGQPNLTIQSVTAGSVAEIAGFKANDVIKTVNGNAITTLEQFSTVIANANIGDTLIVRVIRAESYLANGRVEHGKVEKDLQLSVAQYHFCDTKNYD